MNSSVSRSVAGVVLGIVLVAVGLFLPGSMPKTISGICLGIGSGLAGMSVANLIMASYYKKHPALQKQAVIDAHDERTLAITNKAKARAFDITMRVLIAVAFLYILADAPLWMTLLIVAVYVSGAGIEFYHMAKYNNEM
jgi:hypothetical protein